MRLKIICFAVIKLLLTTSVLAQDFTVTQKRLIASKIDELLENYRKYSGLSEDGAEISALYTKKFNELFTGTKDVYVYNDIDPEKLLDEKITVAEYVTKVKSWYKAGLAMRLSWDAMFMSDAVQLPDSKKDYSVSLLLEKQVMGIYKSEIIINNTNDLYFIIEFERSGKAFSNFKIAGIQKEKPVLEIPEEPEVEIVEKKKEQEKQKEPEKEPKEEPEKEPKKEPKQVTRKEMENSISLYFNPLYTQIYNNDVYSDDNWKAEGTFGYSGGIGYTYYLSRSVGVFGGLSLTNYKTNLKLENFNIETNTLQLIDKDNDVYYRYIQADVEEQNSLTYLDVSLGANLNKYIKENAFGIYLSAGGQFSYLFMSKYKITGSSTHTGYYPEYHVVLYDLPDYDFTSENLDDENDWELNSFNISAYLSFGVFARVHRLIYLSAGPYIVYGVADLKYDTAKHRDDYISTIGVPGRTNTQAAGLNISLIFVL
ncbi:MAG: outer membrane beta-barrel protein [Bacteroidales bacterium]|nr:MAG: outer membrane beta-barrel protein [Bacteroidales bacterium]